MINKSIYRQGGTVNWTATISQVKAVFQKASAGASICITAGGKAWGKSTAFEYLSQFAPDVAIEGDIMSVLAYTIIAGHEIDDKWSVGDLASGKAIPGFVPWTMQVEGDKDKLFNQALTSILGKGWESKISLATSFHGWEYDVTLRIMPDYKFYTDMMEARTKSMLNDKSKSDEWRRHVKEQHRTLSWKEFYEEVSVQLLSARKDGSSIFVPNFGLNFDDAAHSACKLALRYAHDSVVDAPVKKWKL